MLFGISTIFGFTAIIETSVANATIIGNISTAMVLFAAPRFLNEKISRWQVLLAFTSFAGVVAIVVGAGTVRADNPSLTVRDVHGPSPRRIVLGNIDPQANVHPCTQWTGTLPDLLDTLGKEGVVQLLVEGGARVAASFHRERLINQYVMHIAPVIAGGDNAAGIFAGPAATTMADMWRGRVVSTTNLDGDIEIILEPNLN